MSPEIHCKFDRNKVAAAAVVAALLFAAPTLAAQGPAGYVAGPERAVLDSALRDEDVQAALLHVNEHRDEMREMLAALTRGDAAPAAERERAQIVSRRMRDIGLKDVSLADGSAPYAVGRIKGRSRGAILFISTMSFQRRIAQVDEGAAHGPNAGDSRVTRTGTVSTAATAAMLAAADAIRDAGLEPTRDLIFAALPAQDAGLDAMRQLYAAYGDSVIAVVDLKGDGESIGCASDDQLPGVAESPLVGAAAAILQWLGMQPMVGSSGSVSVQVATANSTPAIVLGSDASGASATSDEEADSTTTVRSAKQIVLLAATLR